MFHVSLKTDKMSSSLCKCGKPRRKGGRYCLDCHAAYVREWRKIHTLTAVQRKKDSCRSYAGTYLRRGNLKRESCEICNSKESQMHHDDYTKPLDVRWLCRECHINLHNNLERDRGKLAAETEKPENSRPAFPFMPFAGIAYKGKNYGTD